MNISYDVLLGLVFLKERGIIHRDVKQNNIMIDRERRARLIDFGSVAPIAGVGEFNPEDKRRKH
jgi:serine/threonine protein kinase